MGQRSQVWMSTFAACLTIILGVAAGGAASGRAEVESRLELGVFLRGDADGRVEQGEPLRVDIRLQMADDAGPGAVVLAPVSGTWVDAIVVQLIDTQGRPTGVRAQTFGRPESAATTLSPGRIAGGLWRFAPESTQALRPGVYALRARLAVSAAAPGSGGWTGEVLSPDIPVEIVVPSSEPGSRAQRALSLARDAILDDRLEEAANLLDALLSEQRDNIQAWAVRAVVSERAGNIFGALQSVNEAHRLYEALGTGEPYVELITVNRRLIVALAAPDAAEKVAAPLPGWTWPPREMLSPPANAFAPAAEADKAGTPPAGQPSEQKPDPAPVAAAVPLLEKAAPPVSAAATAPAVASVTIVPWAEVDEAGILADPRGQWASSAGASSEYANDRYSAARTTGAPDVTSYSDNPNAWCHSGAGSTSEWLYLGFARPVRATELRVRQSFTPGAIARVELFATDGSSRVLWEGTDPNSYPPGRISWFVLRFPAATLPVQRVRLTLNLAAATGWKQIDAVQLAGDSP